MTLNTYGEFLSALVRVPVLWWCFTDPPPAGPKPPVRVGHLAYPHVRTAIDNLHPLGVIRLAHPRVRVLYRVERRVLLAAMGLGRASDRQRLYWACGLN